MPGRTLVIFNPRSRGGVTGRRLERILSELRSALGPVEVEATRAPRDAERIAREGVRAGAERIVVAGGDGTLSEVATGLLGADLAGYASIGLLPLGTGGDFGRTLGIPGDLRGAIAVLAEGAVRRIDAGVARYRDRASRETLSYFVNIASFGLSGLVDALVNDSTKPLTARFLGGRAAFLAGTVRGLLRYRSASVHLRVDGESVHEGPLVLATAANGRYFGGGMCVAPRASVDDGALDVTLVGDVSKPKLLAELPALYRGTHLEGRLCTFHRGRTIEAEAESGAVLIDVDGEPLGALPAVFEVLPRALSVIGPAA